MEGSGFLEIAGIPLLLVVVFVYYGLKVWIKKDISAIRGKQKPPVKDEVMYAKWAGGLILFLAFAALGMAFLLFVNVYAALIEFIAAALLMGILWRRMEQRYGG